MKERLKAAVQQVLNMLAVANYAEVENLTHGVRFRAEDIASAISEYGRTLIPPPEEAFALMNVVEVRNAIPRKWSIVVPLWTREEGRSDLSAEFTIVEDHDNLRIELDDIHVL